MLVSFCINIKEKQGCPFLYPLVLSRSGHRATLDLILMQQSHLEMLNWCQTMMTQETEEKLEVSTGVHLSGSLCILSVCVIHPQGKAKLSVLRVSFWLCTWASPLLSTPLLSSPRQSLGCLVFFFLPRNQRFCAKASWACGVACDWSNTFAWLSLQCLRSEGSQIPLLPLNKILSSSRSAFL